MFLWRGLFWGLVAVACERAIYAGERLMVWIWIRGQRDPLAS